MEMVDFPFTRLDEKTNAGSIDFAEFCQMMRVMNKETDQELIRLAFK